MTDIRSVKDNLTSNEEVLQRANETKTMLDTLRKRNVWLGHVLKHESLLHDIF